jgi:hypothetical protein
MLSILQSKSTGNVMWLLLKVLLAAAVKLCVAVGFHEAFQTTAQLCGKRCVEISSSVTSLIAEAFCHRSSLGLKHESITWNCRQKDSNWNGIIQLLL